MIIIYIFYISSAGINIGTYTIIEISKILIVNETYEKKIYTKNIM